MKDCLFKQLLHSADGNSIVNSGGQLAKGVSYQRGTGDIVVY